MPRISPTCEAETKGTPSDCGCRQPGPTTAFSDSPPSLTRASASNAAQHTAVLSDGEAKLLQGSVRLLSAAYDSDPEGYLIEIRSGTSEWARQAAAEMFNTLGISFRDGSRPR